MFLCRNIGQVLAILWICSATQGFLNSPKIIAKDGNLIFESGLNRNISFRLIGKSRLNINDEFDLLDLIQFNNRRRIGRNDEDHNAEEFASLRELAQDLADFKQRVFGRQGLDARLMQLQNRSATADTLRRRYRTRLRFVERKVQRLTSQLEVNNCQSYPCENAGICFNTFDGFLCKCSDRFEGARCERDVNECALYEGTDLGCQNGAQCVNQFGTYSCICTPGWYGVHCTQRKGDCSQSSSWELCGHGSCVSSNDAFGYKCLCEPGWRTNGLTPACTVDVDECSAETHTPCATRCINLPGSFTCAPCGPGLTGNGVNCRDNDECAANNGGCSLSPRVACINTYGSYHCADCPLGWYGDGRICTRSSTTGGSSTADSGAQQQGMLVSSNCAQAASICHPLATCIEISNTVVCSCPAGTVGNGIGPNGCISGTANNCNTLPCLNGGTCIDTFGGNFTCICPVGYRAPICEPIASPCQPNPCRNGGRCRRTAGAQFICQCTPGYRGRLCDTRFSSCGGLLAGEQGRLHYPPDGTGYEHNAQCAWVIRTNESSVLNVTFNAFDLEDSTECRFDWLQLNDGRSAASQLIGRYCGHHKPHGGQIISSTNYLYLWFRSDNSTSKEGFELEWSSMPPQCGGVLQLRSHGTLATPGSPGNYPKNRDCHWQLRAPSTKRIKLTFFSLQIEKHDNCNFDYVEITDAISGYSLYKFCNSTHPAPLLLPTSEADLHFHSDNEGSDSGFQILYSIEERVPGCGGTYSAKEGTIKSPLYAAGDAISCEYDIRMGIGESVSITFNDFRMGADECVELYDVDLEHNESMLQSKFCGGPDNQPPVMFFSLFNAVQVKFYAKGGTFELKYRMECSYTFESSNGTITTPNYPKLTNDERFCTYKIITAPETLIALNTVDFDLRDSSLSDEDECTLTYLRINDGLDKNIMGPYCGNSTPSVDLVSETNMLIMHLKTGSSSYGRGFKFEYKSVPFGKENCGGVYTKLNQTIRLVTDDSSSSYDNDMTCIWVIMAPAKKGILLHWLNFELESSSDCTYDYLEIYDNVARSSENKPLARFCGSHVPADLLSHSRMLTLKFVSDFNEGGEGFQLTYDFVDYDNCGGPIYASNGRINSPAYPQNYTKEMDCEWVLTGPIGTQIELQIELFELEKTPNCNGDWLEIRNGPTRASTLIGRFCGRAIPSSIPAFTNRMLLHFHSDSFVNARGFRISWHVYANGCGGVLHADSGVITSPEYPNSYPNNAECEWRVIVHPGSVIHFTIEDMEMEDIYECYYDNLRIYEGDWTRDLPLKRICSIGDTPMQLDTLKHEATILFTTDSSNTYRGFRMSFTTNCTRQITNVEGIIESLNFGEFNYERPINCSWTIKAPKGNKILVEFTHFEQLYASSVFFITGQETKRISTPADANTFESSGDTLTIVHNSSDVSFRLEYRLDGCIEVLRRESGEFHTPNYPQMYPNNIECMWEIHSKPGVGIELTITDFDVEGSINCTKDALVISNHPVEHNTKERHCGYHDKLVVTSSGQHLYVRFISDDAHNGRGFKATYSTIKSKCGGVMTSKTGIIQSPNYPQPYPAESDCEWTIEVSSHHGIVLELEEMEIESGLMCSWDYVEAVETYDADAGEVDGDGDGEDTNEVKVFKICGTYDAQPLTRWNTSSNTVTVRFASDESNQAKGFKLSFRETCGESVSIDETDYGYLQITRHAITNETCIWILKATDLSKHIIFTPLHVMLHPSVAAENAAEGDCIEHGIKIYDGTAATGTPRAKFCLSHPPAIISNGHALTVTMPANIIMEFEGSYITMDTVCGDGYDALSGKFSTPHYPNSYPVNMDCTWTITASAGNSISLTFESMDLESSDECNNDYVEVRESDFRGKLLGVYCGNELPPVVKGTESLWIKFQSNDDLVGEGFLASYNYETHNEISGTNGTIESPRYPSKLHARQPYSWRITVDKDYVVLLTIKHVIDIDIPYIKFYDGYSDIGTLIDYASTNVIRSSTNIVYFTAERGPFQFEWQRLSKVAVRTNRTAEEQAVFCGKQDVLVNNTIRFKSPGYPNGYAPNLKCTWMFLPANPAMHAVLQFSHIDLEEFSECFADYIRVSNSTDLQTWSTSPKICTQPNSTINAIYHGRPYLKLEFITDASINKTGFESIVSTECGSELVDRRGFVNITALVTLKTTFQMDCVWTIRVRQGHRIRITFPSSEIRNPTTGDSASNAECQTFFVVRNGFAEDSPFLGKGKYCDNNIEDVLETTSNRAYINFRRLGFRIFNASFAYEEISHECSDEIVLFDDMLNFDKANITSPNYPNLPNPHSECIWKISVPSHHVIAVSFVGAFELASGSAPNSEACDQEFLQINDGSTELSPLVGRYCGKQKPDTVYSTGSVLRIKYFTDISEPKLGFKAMVSLGRCGGTYYRKEGVISTPDKLKVRHDEPNFECVYTIEVEQGNIIKLDFEALQLPDNDNCTEGAHVVLQEINSTQGEEQITDTVRLCGTDLKKFIVETNKIVIRYKLHGQPQPGDGFRIHYESLGARCGETIVADRGVLQTPGYPNGVRTPIHCVWHIIVQKGRRVKVEVLDFDTGASNPSAGFGGASSFHGRLTFANDFKSQSIIARYTNTPPAEIMSTDNTMSIDAFLLPFNRHRGFKLRFSASGWSSCPNRINLSDGGSMSFNRSSNSVLYCNFDLNVGSNQTLALDITKHISMAILMANPYVCAVISPLKLYLHGEQLLPKLLCHNETMRTVRLPFSTNLELAGTKRNDLEQLIVNYQLYECGGLRTLRLGDTLVITQPLMAGNYSGKKLDCAWAVWPFEFDEENIDELDNWMDGVQIEVSLSVDFSGQCQDNFLLVYNGPNQNSPHLGRYCNQATLENMVVERGLFFEYHTTSYDTRSTFNLTLKHGSGCGGQISYPYREIYFNEQYQNNVECIWEIHTDKGFHIGLSFIDRFFIESSKNCTKDYILVQQKSDSTEEWIDLRKICGRDPPTAINTTTVAMRLIFRSDGETTGDGFTAKFERNCGGTLYATSEQMFLSSPGYPVQYEKNLVCNYTILPKDSESQGVLVRFHHFELEDGPIHHCIFDNVTIQTVSKSNAVTESVICGVKRKHEYRGQKSVSVVLRTDYSYSGKGFELEYTTNLCGGVITGPQWIDSPRQHNDNSYPPSSNCDWRLKGPVATKIIIKFEKIDFESQSSCNYDGVEVYAGLAHVEAQRLVKLCGNLTGQLPIINIPTNEGLIYSYSDHRDTSRGFRAFVNFIPSCDRRIVLGYTNSTFELTDYAGGYADNLDCTFTFHTEPDRQLQLEFNSFHVESSSSCQDDFLEVRDGAGPFGDEIGRFCGHAIPAKVISSRNSIFIRFVSNAVGTDTGFAAVLTAIPRLCGSPNVALNETTTIRLASPQAEDGNYPNNVNCFWKIVADKAIHLKFDKFDIEASNASDTCDTDYLKIYNSEDAEQIAHGYGSEVVFNGHVSSVDTFSYAAEHLYCGQGTPDDYYSNSKAVYVKFFSNGAVTRPGFSLTAMQMQGCYRNFTGTQGRIKLTETEDHCDIYINAPENTTLSLYYFDVIFSEYDCNEEYVEVFDTHTNKSLQKLCSYLEVGKSLFSNTNKLRMRIKMNHIYTEYNMIYLASHNGPGCGGELYNTEGIITSPFYPNNVRNNSDCRWHIRVPINTRVLLRFDDFNLGVKATCHSDYLQIIETNNNGGEQVMRQYCGEDRPKYYKSERSSVIVRFHKTVNYDGTGWVIRFNSVYNNYQIPDYLPY